MTSKKERKHIMIQQPAKISEKEEEKIQQLFFDAFLEDVQFDQTQNAIFILAQKTPIFVIRAGRPRVIPLSVPFQGISPTHLQQKARRGIVPGGPSSIITLET